MAAWILVPCLVALRDEFNEVAPGRDKGADGSIGDSNHTSASDHTPDEDSDVLRGHDADSKNEVHALDIDSSGPWPAAGWFDRTIRELVAREKQEYESPTAVGRLKYVIWNRQIASRSWGWTWRPYTLADPHTNHAHFSARYDSGPEADTRPWGVAEEDDVTKPEFLAWITEWAKSAAGREALAVAVLSTDGVVPAPPDSKNPDGSVNTHWAGASYLRQTYMAAIAARGYSADARALVAKLQEMDPGDVAAAIPAEMARQVADLLAARLAA